MEVTVELRPLPGKCFVVHCINSSSSLQGFRAVIVPPELPVPAEYGIAGKSTTNTYVYLQTANPFCAFPKFSEAEREQSLILLQSDYVELITFWRDSFQQLKTALFKEAGILKNPQEAIKLTGYFFFVGQGVCFASADLNSKLRLTAWIENTGLNYPGAELCMYVKLVKEGKRFTLPVEAFNELLSCADTNRCLQNYFTQFGSSSGGETDKFAHRDDPTAPPSNKKSKSQDGRKGK